MHRRGIVAHAAILCIAFTGMCGAAPKAPHPPKPAMPADQNRFTTVDDFLHAHRAPKTTVSVEGYVVLASMEGKAALRLAIVDSVDHVLSVRDAVASSRGGCIARISATAIKAHPTWGWRAKGMERFAMYAGSAGGVRQLHDTVAKLRITGLYIKPNGVSPVTLIEYQNDDGEWTKL
ncbi:MAG: hypothetical protein ACP5VE_03535 [Chthonomonadales bacterium]